MSNGEVMKMSLARESKWLIVICTLDLALTLFLMQGRLAYEGNPLMAYFLSLGIWPFVMAKVALVAVPIAIFEWGRQYRPAFVRLMVRTTIAAYLAVYLLLFITVNLGI